MKKTTKQLILCIASISLLNQITYAQPSLQNQSWALRASDGLLERPDLQAVVEVQCKRDAAGLKPFFSNKDPLVRARAAFAAGSIQDPANLPDLYKLLRDDDPRVRVDAAFALRQTSGASTKTLLKRLKKEKDKTVQAMLLGALGFQGDEESYEKIISKDFPGQETPYILCLIYYLQRNIVSSEGIHKVLKLIHHDQPEVREHAAYFFYVMKRQKAKEPDLGETLLQMTRQFPYDDIAAPYLLRYLAAQESMKAYNLLNAWRQSGKSVRARSVALEGFKYLTDKKSLRQMLIYATITKHFHTADTAAEVVSGSEHITEEDLGEIKKLLDAGHVRATSRIHFWRLLWERGEKKYIEDMITKTSTDNPIALITAISAAQSISYSTIKKHLNFLIPHPNPQVNTLTGSYIAQQLGVTPSSHSYKVLDQFLNQVPDIKVRSEVLFEAAFTVKDKLTKKQSAELFQKYYEKFLEEKDLPSAASCLIILGWTQHPEVLPLIEKAKKHPREIIRTAAEGAHNFHTDGAPKPINHCELNFAPVLKMDWDFLAKYGRHPKLVFTTRLGDIVVQLDAEQAPMGTQNLIHHVEAGNFNNLHIYRHVPNHVIQAGPQGHFGYRILSEFTRIPKEEHTFGIGDYGKDTASQHIAITHLMRPHNEGKYTNLGLVTAGRSIVKDIDKYDVISKATVIADKK